MNVLTKFCLSGMLTSGLVAPTLAASESLQQRDVFIAGQGGYYTYRIPALTVTRSGALLAFCEGRKNSASDTGDIDLLLKRSTDDGQTWSPQQVVWDDGPNTCGNPCPVLDETTGVIWLLLTHNPGDSNEKQIKEKHATGTRTVWLLKSEDDGKTWGAPVNITGSTKDPSWGWYATGPGVGIHIQHGPHKGRLVVPCDHSYDDPQGTLHGLPIEGGAHVIYSDDHGQTWKLGGSARPKMNECQVVELAGGKGTLLLNMRNSLKKNRRAQSVSCDGGETWTKPEAHPQLIEPRCQASLLRYDWPEGKDPGRLLFSNPAGIRRTNLTVRVSYDDGKSWSVSRTLHAGPSAYSCLAVLPAKSIGCLYECGETNAYERIAFARFPMSWLEAGSAKGGTSSHTTLFTDDHDILYRPGTERVLSPLKRRAENPLIRGHDKPWEVAISWVSVYRNPDTGRYQLWYQAFAGDAARDRTRRCTVCYAESQDGIHFTRPSLDLFDFNGIRDTSIVLVANGGASDRYGVSVVADPQDPDPARRYKMAYFDFTSDSGREYPGLNVAFSPDGIHWSKHPCGPLSRASYGNYGDTLPFRDDLQRPWDVPLSMADALDVFYDPPRQAFAIYGKMWIDGPDGKMYWKHAMGRIESKDFIRWSKPQLVLTPDEHDPPWVEFHTAPVGFCNGLYFSPLQILDRKTAGGVVDVELATSRDGRRWDRPFRNRFWLARSPGNRFDSGALFVCPQAVFLEDEVRFYYGAYSQGATGSDDSKLMSGIGMATMARDRFAGLRSLPQSEVPALRRTLRNIGQITLRPIDLSGVTSLSLNADATNGVIRIELLDADGRRIHGFTADDAVPIKGDSLRHPVCWRSGTPIPPGKHIVRVHLENATAYALTLHGARAR